MTESTATPHPTWLGRIRDVLTDALRYWEPRRIVYNAVLALVVVVYFVLGWLTSGDSVTADGLLFLFVLAVLANVAYCAAYLGDIFVQLSGFQNAWHRWRWLLFTIGTLFAATITRFFAVGFFSAS